MGDLWGRLLDNLHAIWPYRIVDIDQQGVRFTLGKAKLLAKAGGFFFLFGLQSIETFVTTYQEIDCQLQSMETADNISITFSANVGYTVHDALLMRTRVQDFDSTLERAARGILGEIVEDSTYAELRAARKRLADRAKKQLIKEVAEWGVTIERFRLTDFTRAKPYRLFGGNTTL